MCGIYASIGFEPDPSRIDVIAHRGPDGEGWKVFQSPAGPLALGHRRLAIIDLDERSSQPMAAEDERYWIVFNGEIYNFVELREELEAKGHSFRTTSDTEVLLRAFVHYGEEMLSRLVGMYAFVIYDRVEEQIFAARDRFGIKPLFYHASEKGVAFASELKQLIELPTFKRSINLTRAYDFLASGITDHMAETLFADAMNVRPGHYVKLNLHSWKPQQGVAPARYYCLPPPSGRQYSQKEAADRFRELFYDSVKLHMRSDVRVGSCLSGGLDSSSIVMVMAEMMKSQDVNEPVHTVSACFPNKEVDEKPYMEVINKAAGAHPHYIYPKPEDVIAKSDQITWHQDEPFGSTSIYAQWCVFEEARENGIKVMLDGQGADEQLAGYHSSFGFRYAQLMKERAWAEFARTVVERRMYHGLSIRKQLTSNLGAKMSPSMLKLLKTKEAQPPAYIDWLSGGRIGGHMPPTGSAFNEALAQDQLGPVESIADLCVAFQSTNLPMLLRYEDRNSMAHSIEARVPFVDHRLIEFNIDLGSQHKIVGGDTKVVLRKGLKDILPRKVALRRDKLGFATPEQAWFRGPLKDTVRDMMEDTLERHPGLIDADNARKLRDEMLDGRRPLDFTIWRIINFGTWSRVFDATL